MGYQKFSDRPQRHHQTLGALGALGGIHPEISKNQATGGGAEFVTLTPPKAPKPPKVTSTSEIGCEVQTSGGSVSLARGKVEAESFGSPSDTWTDADEERAAIIEFDGGAPRAWAEALARLDPNKPPEHVPLHRWLRFIDDCGRFLDGGWADKAAAFGWGPFHLFGCDRTRPYARNRGLLWEINGGRLIELDRNRATIETRWGAQL